MFKTNDYFDGKVKSIAFQSDTLPATIGVMAPGEYTFNTAAKEQMTVVSGELGIQLPGQDDWVAYAAGQTFGIPANSAFGVKVSVETAYLCVYG